MRVIILIDANNFERGFFNLCKEKNDFRYLDFYKISNFIINYLANNLQFKNQVLQRIRTYFYTGELTDKLIGKIERALSQNTNNKNLDRLLSSVRKQHEKQSVFFRIARGYYFFEIRAKPLQFVPSVNKIVQKGVDVQLAVDLVDFTHKDIFDVGVILSGDIDLLDSIKMAKNLGKQIIVFGDGNVTAEEMKSNCDLFIDISRFKAEQLNEFSHVPKIKKE